MILVLAFAAAAAAQLALKSVYLWPLLAAGRPLLLVVVGGARRWSTLRVAWLGLAAGLVSDALSLRPIGPGGVAGAAAGTVVAIVTTRFELEGPLFWVVGSLVAATVSEAGSALILTSLGATPDHGWLGGFAAVAATAVFAVLVALTELAVRAWNSPARRRRRSLRRS